MFLYYGSSRKNLTVINHAWLCQLQVAPVFPEYLVLGESVAPPELVCANLSSWYYHHDATTGNVTKQPIMLRSAVIGSFRSLASGAVASVVASVVHTAQTVTIVIANGLDDQDVADSQRKPFVDETGSLSELALAKGGAATRSGTVLYGGRGAELKRWDQGAPAQVECDLGPFGVCVLVVQN